MYIKVVLYDSTKPLVIASVSAESLSANTFYILPLFILIPLEQLTYPVKLEVPDTVTFPVTFKSLFWDKTSVLVNVYATESTSNTEVPWSSTLSILVLVLPSIVTSSFTLSVDNKLPVVFDTSRLSVLTNAELSIPDYSLNYTFPFIVNTPSTVVVYKVVSPWIVFVPLDYVSPPAKTKFLFNVTSGKSLSTYNTTSFVSPVTESLFASNWTPLITLAP